MTQRTSPSLRQVARGLAAAVIVAIAGCRVPGPSFMGEPARDLERGGVAALRAGDFARAEKLFSKALALAEAEQDCKIEISSQRYLAIVAERLGRAADTAARLDAALAAAKRCGDLEAAFDAGIAVARLALDRDDVATAGPRIEEARLDAVRIGTVTARGEYLVLHARLLLSQGALVDAETAIREAIRTFDMQGTSLERTASHARARRVLASILLARGDPVEAISELRTVAALADEIGDRRTEAEAHEEIAAQLLARGLREDARIWFEEAFANRVAGADSGGALAVLDRLEALAREDERADRLREYAERREKMAGGDP